MTSLVLKNSFQARLIAASRKLPAGERKFLTVYCGHCSQQLPAERFACIHKKCHLRNNLLAAIGGIFARASFTVQAQHKIGVITCHYWQAGA